MTAELIITIEPPDSAKAGVNSWQSRSVPNNDNSRPLRMTEGSVCAKSFIDGFAKALLTRASTWPNASMAAVTRAADESSSVISVVTVTARRPSAPTSPATDSIHVVERAARTTSAPAAALCSAIDRPREGPTPETTTTLPASAPVPIPPVIPASVRRRPGVGRRFFVRNPRG